MKHYQGKEVNEAGTLETMRWVYLMLAQKVLRMEEKGQVDSALVGRGGTLVGFWVQKHPPVTTKVPTRNNCQEAHLNGTNQSERNTYLCLKPHQHHYLNHVPLGQG